MVKVLIIDDEPNVRMGLKKMIDWDGNGFYVCGEAEEADEGYKKIMNLKPDIVLIDIKMPGKLGTDLIRETREKGFDGKFIILSGYSNFEYAQEAIKYGVKSYILKPIDEDELLEVLLKLKDEIKKENKVKNDEDIIRKVNLRKIITGEFQGSIPEDNKCYTLALLSVDENKKEEFIDRYINAIEEIDIIRINQYIALLFKETKYDRVLKILDVVKEKVKEDISFFAVISEEVQGMNNLFKVYTEALEIIKNKFIYLQNKIIQIDKSKIINKSIDIDIDNHIKKLQSYVEVQDIDKIDESIDILNTYVIENKYSEDKIKAMGVNILLNIREKLFKDYDISKENIDSNEVVIRNIYSKNSILSMTKYLKDELNSMSKMVSLGSSDNNVKRIISYMEKNYYKDLKLETLAKIFNYNSAYLGKLLKNSIGENFNTKLDKIRIEKAKSLLVSDKLKVYQVCEKVGYKNIDYFHSKFKKYVGTTPLNYKKKNEKVEK